MRDSYSELREELSVRVRSIYSLPRELHQLYANLPWDNIITTNYDQCIEMSLQNVEWLIKNPGSTRNILDPCVCFNKKRIYHAHGVDKWKNTLCISTEHYASLISKIQPLFYDENGISDKIEKLIKNKQLIEIPKWPELFFISNVDIVGFGCDYYESDMWWLLALRAALFAPCNRLAKYENEITFHKIVSGDKKQSVKKCGHLEALAALGVAIEETRADSYLEGYRIIAEKLSNKWIS